MTRPSARYLELVAACEADLDQYGDTFQGVGWTKGLEYAAVRYRVMLDLIAHARRRVKPVELLDVGCGASHLLEYIRASGVTGIQYSGLDLSSKYLALSKRKFPSVNYYEADLLAGAKIPSFDYLVVNGLFTYRGPLSHDEMWDYFRRFVERAFAFCREGMAFNVMSKYVDWERDDLFHVPIQDLTDFVASRFGRNFIVRHDYGLFEYTVYVYRAALGAPGSDPLGKAQ